ncbi:RTA1 like protein-domain-containing protein [Chaetomium sp. MPI-CAGE-AT-0009]|nr:RTA1 like protein-domain-containing protein [Chaetomium sp. MPI-CAGE-AT-0009]
MPTPTATLPSSPKCTTATPDRHGYVPPTACNANYGFYPSWEWNLVFAIGFFLASLLHIAQLLATRKWFCWVAVMGALWEYACFVLRTLGALDQQNGGLVVGGTLLFLLAPLWINAFVYMVVARLIHFLLPPHSQKILGMSPRWLAKAFVAVDVVSFFIQASGGGMLADQDGGDTVKTGQRIYMAGIGVQLAFVVIFVIVTVLFTVRLERLIGAGLLEARHDVTVTRHLVWPMLVVLGLIVVRIVFRFVEFSGGVSSSNPILANEAYQLALDALPMLIALLLMNAVHPGKVLKGPESSFPRTWPRRWRSKSENEHELLDSSNVELNGHRYGRE